jgi:hypothetical protein
MTDAIALSAFESAEPPRRYQRDRPGELIHIDIKKLGKVNRIDHRITGNQGRRPTLASQRLALNPPRFV